MRLRSVKCEDPGGESRPVGTPYSTRGRHVSNLTGRGEPRNPGHFHHPPPPLGVVQTPQPRLLARNAYFRMVDRRKMTVES